ncbi:hypothetical protein FMM56_06740 [Campylobacter sp. LR264d]|uniref:hypothetical protein n=1 Tax=unclassified Campylobacter TaxID=2593542 RepID=UPI001237D777|nr:MULTISPECIES: hypothetical protein [unclassified Campylobacter]KAA6224685.1 hypothetical protein FMM54_07510 [Campylobacter sp. LR185c]KAA6230098.1 hypothetical protein FMM56_06740 [Campylobacter sp. LR264d]KAA8603973.1 hypothetical protein CGP82_04850 [Campylobacter sp. LR185c]
MGCNLQESLKERFGTKGLEELEIPKHIKDNLSKDLREYQTNALKYYLTNEESFKKNHLFLIWQRAVKRP